MTRIVIAIASDRPPKRRRFREGKYEGLLGNRALGGHLSTGRENTLMTARRDILSIRESILSGNQEEALAKSDWTLDQIENKLSERC